MEDLLGILIRASVMYLYVLTIIRLSGKRTIGAISPADFAVATMLGDMFDDVIWAEVPLAKGIVGISTIMLIHLLVVYTSYKNARIDHFFGAQSTMMVRDGKLDEAGLRRERLRPEEVEFLLRQKGVDRLDEIKESQMEPGDTLSVLRREAAKPAQKRDLPLLKEVLL